MVTSNSFSLTDTEQIPVFPGFGPSASKILHHFSKMEEKGSVKSDTKVLK